MTSGSDRSRSRSRSSSGGSADSRRVKQEEMMDPYEGAPVKEEPMEKSHHKDNGESTKKESKKRRKRSRSSSSSRSRSRSRSRERRRGKKHGRRSRSSSRSTYSERRSRSGSPGEKRLHVAQLDGSVRRRDVEDAFAKYGRISDLWVASYPPYYAFVVYDRADDAREALKAMKNGYIRNCPIRTSIALPRANGRFRDDRYGGGGGGGYGGGGGSRRRSRSRSPRRRRSSTPPRRSSGGKKRRSTSRSS